MARKKRNERAKLASGLELRSFNLDLMHGLPDQSLEEALAIYARPLN